jgi:dimethylhistidine N-methyltransferase
VSVHPTTALDRYSLIEGEPHGETSFADEVRLGLSEPRKSIPCRFLYDDAGSRLFEEICDVPEYYLTRVEREILESRSHEIADRFAERITLAELGSGNAEKTRLLIEAFLHRHGGLRYVPVDISRAILEDSSRKLLEDYRALEILAIASEYREGLRHVRAETDRQKLVAWLGSNVGNFERDEGASFLRGVREALSERDRLLIGIDLRKNGGVLERAYDDSKGVTARFSLNLLVRMNRELGAEFDIDAFEHRALYLEDEGRVEISLVSRRTQRVSIDDLGLEIDFAEGEPIHTESAMKYSFEEIEKLAADAGMRVDHRWVDPAGHFSLNLFAPS